MNAAHLAVVATALVPLLNGADAASIFANGDFETGAWNPTMTGAGSPATSLDWAPIIVADEWMVNNLGNKPALWIENPAMAKSGNRFAWMRGEAAAGTPFGAGGIPVGMQFHSGVSAPASLPGVIAGPPNFVPGVTYEFSMWIANAGTTYDGQAAFLGVSTWAGSFLIPPNLAWSDTAASVIPWQKISGTFTAANDVSMAGPPVFYASPIGLTGPDLPPNTRTSFVIDALEFSVVPEPSSAGLLAMALLALSRQRGRREQ